MTKCEQLKEHKYFIAETVAVQQTGKIYILVVCTACGDFLVREAQVADGSVKLQLKNNKGES